MKSALFKYNIKLNNILYFNNKNIKDIIKNYAELISKYKII